MILHTCPARERKRLDSCLWKWILRCGNRDEVWLVQDWFLLGISFLGSDVVWNATSILQSIDGPKSMITSGLLPMVVYITLVSYYSLPKRRLPIKPTNTYWALKTTISSKRPLWAHVARIFTIYRYRSQTPIIGTGERFQRESPTIATWYWLWRACPISRWYWWIISLFCSGSSSSGRWRRSSRNSIAWQSTRLNLIKRWRNKSWRHLLGFFNRPRRHTNWHRERSYHKRGGRNWRALFRETHFQ